MLQWEAGGVGGGERGREDKTGTVSAGLSVSQHRDVKRSREASETMVEDFTKTRRRSCFLLCISLLVVFGTVLGFLAGFLVGGILAKHGHFSSVLNQGEAVPPVSRRCPLSLPATRATGSGASILEHPHR